MCIRDRNITGEGILIALLAIPGATYLSYKVFQDFEKRALATTCANTIYLQMFTGILMILGVLFI